MRPQAEEVNLRHAAWSGDLATLTRLVAEGVNLEAKDEVGAAPPAASLRPLALRPRRPPPLLPPALTAAAHRVWRRRRASAERPHGPHVGG